MAELLYFNDDVKTWVEDRSMTARDVVNRALLDQLFPPTALARNTSTVQYDSPDRQMPSATQTSLGYERQVGSTMSFGVDYSHNEGRNWIGYDLNPAWKVR